MNVTNTSHGGFVVTADITHTDAECKACTKLVMHTIVGGCICLLGLLGNTASFVVLSRDKSAPVASFMLQSLAMVDNVFLSLWFVQFSLSEAFSFYSLSVSATWLYVRLYSYPLLFVGQTATIWMTVLIAVCRFIAVCKPYKATKLCSMPAVKRGVMTLLASCLLYNIPRYFETSIIYVGNGNHSNSNGYTFVRTAFGDNELYKWLYFDASYYTMCFGLPLLLLLILNTKLTISYRRVLQRRRYMRNSRMQRQSSDHNITLVMILVIMSFIVCNTPARIVQIAWRYKPQSCLSVPFMMSEISNVLEIFNSSVNFLIYCVFRKQFRETLTQEICKRRVIDSIQHTHHEDIPVQMDGRRRGDGVDCMAEVFQLHVDTSDNI